MDFLNSFFQNIKDKLTSPFFGTLSFVLLVHHWEFWYTIFNFDDQTLLSQRLAELDRIASIEFTFAELRKDLFWALGIMVLGYFIVVATRSFSLLIDFRAMPWITGQIISKSVVERRVHEDVLKERDEYSEKYEEQRQFVRKYSMDYDFQAEQVQEKNMQISDLNNKITNLNSQTSAINTSLSTLNIELEDVNKRLRTKEKDLLSLNAQLGEKETKEETLETVLDQYYELFFSPENHNFYDSKDKFPPTIRLLVEKLKIEGRWKSFRSVAIFERYGGSTSTDNYVVLEPELIIPNTRIFTAAGKILKNYFELFE